MWDLFIGVYEKILLSRSIIFRSDYHPTTRFIPIRQVQPSDCAHNNSCEKSPIRTKNSPQATWPAGCLLYVIILSDGRYRAAFRTFRLTSSVWSPRSDM